MLSCEFCEIFESKFFKKHIRATASAITRVKPVCAFYFVETPKITSKKAVQQN